MKLISVHGVVLAAEQVRLFAWQLGFVIAALVIVVVVALVQNILVTARRIGVQAQAAIQRLNAAQQNTTPLRDVPKVNDMAIAIVSGLTTARKALGG